MPGLFDFLNDPQTAGLLGGAAGILNASGPSLMPHSFGQVMGAGLQGMTASRKEAQDRQREQMQMDMLKQQVEQATRKNALINNFLAANLGGAPQPDGAVPAAAAGGGQAGPGVPAQPGAVMSAPSAPTAGAVGSFGGVPSAAIAADLAFNNGGKMGEWINDRSKPADFTKLLQQSGIDPNSPLGRQLMQAQVAKQNYVAPLNARPGSILRDPNDPSKIIAFNPHIPDGGMPQFDANGNVSQINALPGAAAITQQMSQAGAAGKASVKPMPAFDASGRPVFTNELDAATGGAAWTGGKLPDATVKLLQTSAAAGNKDAAAALASYQRAQLTPSLAPGVEKSISGNVETMNSDFSDLYAANKNAPVTLAILDNIKQLAPKSITGSQSDKLAYMNGLLTLGGLPAAKDLASASDLLNKNANMLAINMRLGASGGGSDALQALAQAANPNSHMQPDAIIKAADEVAGQVRMRQAQYQHLLPFKMKNDVQGYYGAQQTFTSGADPRSYQPDAIAKAVPAAGQKFDMLPPAAQFDGKRMRADSGVVYRSQGGKWIRE
jgi:hypothetical protein